MALTTDTDAAFVAEQVMKLLKAEWPTLNIRLAGVITGEVDIAMQGDDGADWIVRVYHPWS